MLDPPDLLQVRVPLDRIALVRERIKLGLRSDTPDAPLVGVLDALVTTLTDRTATSAAAPDCIAAAFEAVGHVLEAEARANAPSDAAGGTPASEMGADDDGEDGDTLDAAIANAELEQQPVTEFTPMLDVTATTLSTNPGPAARPQQPVDAELLSQLIAIEVAAGASKPMARASAQAALGDRDAALAAIVLPVPPPMQAGELRERLERLVAQFAALGLTAKPNDGQPEDWQDAAE